MQPDIDMFRMFLFRVRDYITPDHLLILTPGDQLPRISDGRELISPDGLINPLSSAAVPNYDAAESAMLTGFNIGCMIHPSGLMFVDFDLNDGTLPVPNEIILHYLQNTLMMKTSSGGYRACFIHDRVSADNKLLYNAAIVGDVIGSGYVVCPGSYGPAHGTQDRNNPKHTPDFYHYYTLLNAVSPARFNTAHLPAGLSLDTRRVVEGQKSGNMDSKPESGDFFTVDGISLEFLRRKLFWVERVLTDIASDHPGDNSAARDLARLGFDPGTIARILMQYRSHTMIEKSVDYAAKIAYAAYHEVKSEGRIYSGYIVEEWLSEEMNWRLTGKAITRDSSGS